MGSAEDDNGSERTVRVEEARRRIDRLVEALHRDRTTAIRFIQLNLVVVSLVGTGVALAYRISSSLEVSSYANRLVVIGAFFLVTSTVLAIVIVSEHSRARHRALSHDLPAMGLDSMVDHYEEAFDRLKTDARRSSRLVSLVAILATWTLPFLLSGIIVTVFTPPTDCNVPGSGLFIWILPEKNPCWMYPMFLLGVLLHLGATAHHVQHNEELSLPTLPP